VLVLLLHTQLEIFSSAAKSLDQDRLEGGQLSSPLDYIQDPKVDQLYYLIQRTKDSRLLLTPNECFFPNLGPRLEGRGSTPDIASLNRGNSFDRITQWKKDDSVEWGVWLTHPGEILAKVWMSGTARQDRFVATFGEKTQTFQPTTNEGKSPQQVASLRFNVNKSGLHKLRITCSNNPHSQPALHWVELSDRAINNSAVVRMRWRPAAAHARFSCAQPPQKVRLWVMEMDAMPGDLGFYSPITTPFGYYGSTWNADGRVNSSINFSLWSYNRKQQEPPIEELSHLLAVGDPDASFGGFGHEGTGVKVRNWKPLAGRQGQRQLFALRREPGEVYDTYYSYFYATDQQHWRFFAAGKKFHKSRRNRALTLGTFVEVPGPPTRQRTGPYVRRMRYRGWLMDEQSRWHPIDQMSVGDIDKQSGLTYTDRGTTADGRFYLQTGGWSFRRPNETKTVQLKATEDHTDVPFLNAKSIQTLTTIPDERKTQTVEKQTLRAQIKFSIRNLGNQPKVSVYWGEQEGLTFPDRWTYSDQVESPVEGENQWEFDTVNSTKPHYVRLLLENDEGGFWTDHTFRSNGSSVILRARSTEQKLYFPMSEERRRIAMWSGLRNISTAMMRVWATAGLAASCRRN